MELLLPEDIGILRPRPPVKWAGGKAHLLPQFEPLFPKAAFDLYIEPFVGGGAVFFHLLPARAVLVDSNEEFINFYTVVRDNLTELVQDLRKHRTIATTTPSAGPDSVASLSIRML